MKKNTRLGGLLRAQLSVAIGDLDPQLLSTLHNRLPLPGGHIVCDLCADTSIHTVHGCQYLAKQHGKFVTIRSPTHPTCVKIRTHAQNVCQYSHLLNAQNVHASVGTHRMYMCMLTATDKRSISALPLSSVVSPSQSPYSYTCAEQRPFPSLTCLPRRKTKAQLAILVPLPPHWQILPLATLHLSSLTPSRLPPPPSAILSNLHSSSTFISQHHHRLQCVCTCVCVRVYEFA